MGQTPYSTQAPVKYVRIVNAGTVQAKSGSGALLSMNINTINNGTVAPTLAMYDVNNTSTLGTVTVGNISVTTTIATPAQVSVGPVGAGLEFNNGLVVVTVGTVDITLGIR